MKILLVGDMVGSPGRRMFKENIAGIKRKYGIAAVVANVENAAAGSGVTAALANEISEAGADALTLGDHTWGQKEFAGQIDKIPNIVRPANFPGSCPGKGWRMIVMPTFRFAVVNIVGRTFMQPADCPFRRIDEVLGEIPKDVPVFVDFHAEATSEKIAMGFHLDGRVTALLGTHTHVQTSDAWVLPGGTAYMTDLGMTGPYIGSLGRDLKPVLKKFITGMPSRFDVAQGPCVLEGAIVEFDPVSKKASSIEPLRLREPLPAERP